MAKTQVTGLNIPGRKQPLPIDEETWGIHGPIQTKWVNLHVYWVLPLSTAIIVALALGAFGAFDQEKAAKIVLVPALATSNSQPSVSTQEQGMTTATVKTALAETETILSAADRIAQQMRPSPIIERTVDLAPKPAPTLPLADSPKPEPPVKSPSIWDLNK